MCAAWFLTRYHSAKRGEFCGCKSWAGYVGGRRDDVFCSTWKHVRILTAVVKVPNKQCMLATGNYMICWIKGMQIKKGTTMRNRCATGTLGILKSHPKVIFISAHVTSTCRMWSELKVEVRLEFVLFSGLTGICVYISPHQVQAGCTIMIFRQFFNFFTYQCSNLIFRIYEILLSRVFHWILHTSIIPSTLSKFTSD